MNKRIMISAGEASGDMHAANIVKALHKKEPGIEVYGMGSAQLRDAGADILIDCADIAVVGLVEVLANYRTIKKALNALQVSLKNSPPDLLVLVDYQEFNFRLAETAKALGIKVLFYISPQIWAWRQHRVHKIGKIIDMMAVILPFEEKFYLDANVPVRFVGNPLVDKVVANKTKEACFDEYTLDKNRPVVGLFPGSRRGEIKRVLPIQLAAAEELIQEKPDLQFIIPVARTLNRDIFAPHLSQHNSLNIILLEDLSYNVIQCCDSIISASGTATLEISLMGVPYCITYKIAHLSYFILKQMVKIKHLGLANIISDKEPIKEFIQYNTRATDIARETIRILDDAEYRQEMIQALKTVSEMLGKSGGINNMAELILEMLC
ncbi:Lipid-A-disaccharide synthase [hydrothermal vent metagenome]|uniref:lipid-A-disaccharide synthase n=1 Tax=hydrothermal vent metagenome TaxID=652676 RepID=A0A3B0X9J0_9ZZZZ